MSLFWKAAAAVLLAVVLGLSLGKQKDIGVLLTMAVCCMVAMIAISYLEPVLTSCVSWRRWETCRGTCWAFS